ncbi:MAG: 30S ribosomal protein S17 [Minisyncoccota bacterium]
MKKIQSTTVTEKALKKKGVVVSVAMNKTIVVAVETLKMHPKYLKQYKSTKKYHVHTEENTHAKGDTVFFQECRPMSRKKHHTIVVL